MVLRRVLGSALANEGRVVLEGEPQERLNDDKVCVSPTTGQSYNGGKRGQTVESTEKANHEKKKEETSQVALCRLIMQKEVRK